MTKEGIKINGHKGTWYEIDIAYRKGVKLYLMESEQYGEDVPALIIDENNNLIMEDVYNGFEDYDEQ